MTNSRFAARSHGGGHGGAARRLMLATAVLAACARPVAGPGADERSGPAPTAPRATQVLATYVGAWDGSRDRLGLVRVADERAAQALVLATLPATASGSSGTTTAPADTVLLHQAAARGLDGACTSAPYGDPGVPGGFQGVCVPIQAITGYASQEVVRLHVELTSLTYTGPSAGTVTTYVKSPSDADFGTTNARGLWDYGRLSVAGVSGQDRASLHWYFQTPDPGAMSRYTFVAVVRGELVAPIRRATPAVSGTACVPSTGAAPHVSSDGRYVAFASATAACRGATGGALQVYRADVASGAVVLVSHGAAAGLGSNGSNTQPTVSSDGRFVAWRSTSTDMLSGTCALGGPAVCDATQYYHDGNGPTASIFVRDLATDAVYVADCDDATLGTVTGFAADHPVISGDGTGVAFETAAPIDAFGGDANGLVDVYVRDVFGTLTEIVSQDSPSRTAGAFNPSIGTSFSDVAFDSADNSFVAGDTGQRDVFVGHVWAATVDRVSYTSGGGQPDGDSSHGAIDGYGYTVAFDSVATNLVGASTTTGRSHVYVLTVGYPGTIQRADGRSLTSGTEANAGGSHATLSQSGRMLTFQSAATNLHPAATSGNNQAFQFDVTSTDPVRQSAWLLSASDAGAAASNGISAVGPTGETTADYVVFFASNSGNLVGDSVTGTFAYVAPLR